MAARLNYNGNHDLTGRVFSAIVLLSGQFQNRWFEVTAFEYDAEANVTRAELLPIATDDQRVIVEDEFGEFRLVT